MWAGLIESLIGWLNEESLIEIVNLIWILVWDRKYKRDRDFFPFFSKFNWNIWKF